MDTLDQRLRQMGGATPEVPPASAIRAAATRRRRHRQWAAGMTGAWMLVIVAVGAVWSTSRDPGASQVSAGPAHSDQVMVLARYERIEYVQSASLNCGTTGNSGSAFDSATFEAWADEARALWRNRVSYPDGSSRELIAVDDAWSPSKVFVSGEDRGAVLGCGDGSEVDVVVAHPGQGSFFSLNPMDDITSDSTGVTQTRSYSDVGSEVPGSYTDSLDRTAVLWRNVVEGFASSGTNPAVPVKQTTEWFVDPNSGLVLEQTYVADMGPLGSAQWTATRVDGGERRVPAAIFDTSSFEASEPIDHSLPSTTTTLPHD